MDLEAQPWFHRLELGWWRLAIFIQRLQLVAKVNEFLGAQVREILATERPGCDLDPCGQPVAVPVIGLIRAFSGDHLDRHVLRGLAADMKCSIHSAKG